MDAAAVDAVRSVYQRYHRPDYIAPDPLLFPRAYDRIADREIVAFVAAALALGRVQSIIGAVRWVLDRLQSPHDVLVSADEGDLQARYGGFVYRFFTGYELVGLFLGMQGVLRAFGSLEACFCEGLHAGGSVYAGLGLLTSQVRERSGRNLGILIADPAKGSACKRLCLFLRWMVRHDAVDPGGWHRVSPAGLLFPMDTHTFRISSLLGLTSRRQPDQRTVVEVTDAFRAIDPEDPVRFDFSLSRLGIHPGLRRQDLIARMGELRTPG
jgi:uncharacterized protein (TIGR02757 family)